jgi:hypothetical protein
VGLGCWRKTGVFGWERCQAKWDVSHDVICSTPVSRWWTAGSSCVFTDPIIMPPMRLNLGFLTTTKSTPTHSSRTTSVDRKRVRFPSLGLSPSSDDEQLVYNTLFLVSSQYQTPLCSARDYSFYSSIRQARWLSYYRSSWPLYLTPVFTSVIALGIHVLKSTSLYGISDILLKCHRR